MMPSIAKVATQEIIETANISAPHFDPHSFPIPIILRNCKFHMLPYSQLAEEASSNLVQSRFESEWEHHIRKEFLWSKF